MKERILIVEDEPLIADVVAFALGREAFEVEIAGDASTAAARAAAAHWDLVILDLALPDRCGLDLCRELRAASTVPIVILTARDSEVDRVLGLEAGADDYLGKPFSTAELVARVRAQLRRQVLARAERAGSVRRVGDITIDFGRREVVVGDVPVHLTNAEFKLLTLLSEDPGRVVSRREIVSRLWSSEFVADTRICDTYVARLRKKIEPDPARPVRVRTVRGLGYQLGRT